VWLCRGGKRSKIRDDLAEIKRCRRQTKNQNSILSRSSSTSTSPPQPTTQVVDELFAYWTLENSEDALEELEEALIVSGRSFNFVLF